MLLRSGSTSPDVGRLEERLKELGLYTGTIDNLYGDGVQTAVISFQKSKGLTPDGVVGDQTWSALFPDQAVQASPLANAPLAQRCLALTGAFETSTAFPDCYAGLTGDFDGQGMSFGVVQWNIGQGTLQPMLREMIANHEDVIRSLFQDRLDDLRNMLSSPLSAQLQWARGIQDPARHVISEPWRSLFTALGRTPEYQAIETAHASAIHNSALQLCTRFGVNTERAVALMFDICVQNNSISTDTEAKIRADFAAIPAGGDPMATEVAKLQSIANRRAEAAKSEFVEDVRVRKLTIANGTGKVHNVQYDLDREFGIGLRNTVPA